MENEAEENFSTVKTVKSLQNDQKLFLDLDEEAKNVSINGTNAGIYEYNITKPISLNKSGSFVEDDDSCLTTTITTNELCDSNSVLSLAGANISENTQIDDSKTEDLLGSKDSKEKLEEQSAFDIQPICMDTNVEELSQSTQSISKVGRRSISHEVGPRQLKYNQIGVYWKDKESRVYARFTWATRKYSKSFYVGPNKPYATVRDAEKAAIRFLLINSPLHRRSHLKHFRFTESDEEEDEPYVGSQALKEARRTKGIMLHFPAPESDDEVWSHYNTSNINPATLYGEIIKKMDNSDNNASAASPITSAREYVTAKHKQSSSNPLQNESKFANSVPPSTLNENISSDELFLALMANQIDNDRMVERQPTGTFMNPSTSTTTVSSKRFKPCSKTETLDSSEMNYSSNQFGSSLIDQNVPSTNNPFIGMDYNTLVAIQHAQMANYYLQQQVAYATAANLAITSNANNLNSNTNPFMFTQYGVSPPITNLDSNRVDESEVDKNLLNMKNATQTNSIKKIAECTMEQYGAVIPSQETKAMPSNITLCNAIPGNYQPDYMAAMAAAYSGWYSPYGYAMPLMSSYTPIVPSIIPNPNILGNQFQNNVNITSGQLQSNNGTILLQKQVNTTNSIDSLLNSRTEKELQHIKEQDIKQTS